MSIEKGSDGRWLVDGKPVVVQTTRDQDGLMYQSANISDEDVTELVETHTFIDVQNQDGERVQLSFDMDGWSLLVKDESELLIEEKLRAKQILKAQQTLGYAETAADDPSAATDAQAPVTDESRTFRTYIERVAAIAAANPGMALLLDEEHGATLDETGRLFGFLLKEPRAESSYEFDPRAWAEDRWDCSTFEQTWGALERPALVPLNPDPEQPLMRGGAGWGAAAGMPVAAPRRYIALSLSASHIPSNDAAQAFQQSNFQFSDSGSMWIIPPAPLRSDRTYLPGWACELIALADQYDARYLHFESDGPVLASLRVYD